MDSRTGSIERTGLAFADIKADSGTNATPFKSSLFVHRAKRVTLAGKAEATPIAEPR